MKTATVQDRLDEMANTHWRFFVGKAGSRLPAGPLFDMVLAQARSAGIAIQTELDATNKRSR